MIKTHILGFPRIGEQRELKTALEAHWRGETSADTLQSVAKNLRTQHWQWQLDANLDFITVGDFSLYDHVADHIQYFGCVPSRLGFEGQTAYGLAAYFAMARGISNSKLDHSIHNHTACNKAGEHKHRALEMTKWFDTNYHHLVPEFDHDTQFTLHAQGLFQQIQEAKNFLANVTTAKTDTIHNPSIKVVLLGPLSFLRLGKFKNNTTNTETNALNLLPALLSVYVELLNELHNAGVSWVQLDEPILGTDLEGPWQAALQQTYSSLHSAGIPILLATYFSSIQGHISQLAQLPIQGLHIDGIRAPQDIAQALDWLPKHKVLSLGLIDGRNIWRTDLEAALQQIQNSFERGHGEVWIAPSCSLLHVPYRLRTDNTIDKQVAPWLAGALEKLEELQLLKNKAKAHLNNTLVPSQLALAWQAHQDSIAQRRVSPLSHNPAVRQRLASLPPNIDQRQSPFSKRQLAQQARFNLPLLPTTTIGSFPQTQAIRKLRAQAKQGAIEATQYWERISQHIRHAVEFQERLGLDVLVHGEAERNDMVEYFGEHLQGFTFSANGWVQSYGSRCVKPPIIYGDVARKEPITVWLTSFAQSLTNKPMKGMLTGPVTLLQWSFVRNDQSREETAMQLALAIRDEVHDLEDAGIGMIQIDEPAFREGLPLHKNEWKHYLNWAARAFRISASSVRDTTQIHTHMCYSEFNDILPNIAAMDADVITIETSRSNMELLQGFGDFAYPNEIGPGVYDIHSPRVPSQQEVEALLRKACDVIPIRNLWVNPDCGLKTRGWEETEAALEIMIKATQALRRDLEIRAVEIDG